MGMGKLKIKRFLKNTYYRKSNGNLIEALKPRLRLSYERNMVSRTATLCAALALLQPSSGSTVQYFFGSC